MILAVLGLAAPAPPAPSPAPTPASPVAATPAGPESDEIIQDSLAPPALPPSRPIDAQAAPRRIWSLALETREATLTSWADSIGPKDVVEWRTWALLRAGEDVSQRLKWEVGARADFLARAGRGSGTLLDRAAYTFEARPWEAYIDVGVLDDLRIKIGNQIIAWGDSTSRRPRTCWAHTTCARAPPWTRTPFAFRLPPSSRASIPGRPYRSRSGIRPFSPPTSSTCSGRTTHSWARTCRRRDRRSSRSFVASSRPRRTPNSPMSSGASPNRMRARTTESLRRARRFTRAPSISR